MMDKLISQQAAIDVVAKWIFEVFGIKESDGTATVFKRLRDLPSAQPEHKTGRWIPDDSELGIKCNKCGKSFSDYVNAGTGYMFLEEIPNFCPNCGEDIRGEG